jgi:regulator of protease activity HflC (stomatin/prohibitin superfamily)
MEYVVGLAVALAVLIALYLSITVVKQEQAIVVFRAGRTNPGRVHGSGLVFVLPIVDRPVRVSLREQHTEASVSSIASGGVMVSADVAIRWRIVDPYLAVMSVIDVDQDLRGLVSRVLNEFEASDAMVYHEQVRDAIEAKLKEVAPRWGTTIIDVKVRRVGRDEHGL